MGGPGSGNRWRYGVKATTNHYRILDVRRLAREGLLKPGYLCGWKWMRNGETVASIQMRAEQNRIILIYFHRGSGGEWKDAQDPVPIERTPCNLGGSRAWFICPAVGCGRRVAILYGGGIFACRHCYQLAYASGREDVCDRAARRADRLRARLGWEPGILNGNGGKPKWMRWRTFERLVAQHNKFVGESFKSGLAKQWAIRVPWLKGKKFVTGDALTVADFSLGAPVNLADMGHFPIEPYAEIRRWLRTLRALPPWQKTLAECAIPAALAR
jgi:hypothetical protein